MMIPFGKTLHDAREAKGYTINQIADMTRMMSATIQALENEDFSKIPAPIYGRGFVKLYCEAVNIAPEPLIKEYMEIVNGNREPIIRTRMNKSEGKAQTVDAPTVVEPIAEEPPPPPKSLPMPPPKTIPTPPPMDVPIPAPNERRHDECFQLESETAQSRASQSPTNGPTLSRYATPLQEHHINDKQYSLGIHLAIPPTIWRIALLSMIAICVLWFAFIGLKTLHKATSSTTTAQENRISAEPTTITDKTSKPDTMTKTQPLPEDKHSAPRKPQEIPQLYIN